MKKKRILFILATSKYSGAENVVITIIKNMSDNFEMAYASPNGEIKKQLSKNNIDFLPMKKFSIKEVKRVVKEYNPDIIHANDFRASFICSLIKRKMKLITHIHNNVPWLIKKNLNSFIFLFTAMRSNKVLIVSDSIKNEYVFSNRINDKYICVDNPIYRSKILDKVTENRKKYDICCVARATKQKNPFRFIEIVSEVKKNKNDIKVVWVGEIDESLKEKIYIKLDEYNLNNNIEFVGFKDNPFNYMASSKVFLLTSDWEGYGLVAFEALTLGLPTVVSKVGGLVNIVNEKCGKLCDKNDLGEYSHEIIKLLTDETYYQRKSKAAIVKSKKLENIESYCKKLDTIYKTL